MRRKGISPLIAAVLLIAFTMAVASIFAQWAPQLMEDAQGDTSEKAGQIQDCSDITLNIVSGDVSKATIQQQTGDTAVGNVTVTWYYTGTGPVQETGQLTTSRDAVQVSTSTDTSSNTLDHIEASPVECEGAAPATYTP